MKDGIVLFEQKIIEKEIVNEFIEYFNSTIKFSKVVYTDWTKKDVLAHIASWHISFANNLLAAVKCEEPDPFKGSLTDVNKREVSRLRIFSISELLEFMTNAQRIIEINVESVKIKEIVYKRGSRNYTPLEHLEIVSRHIKGHLDDLRKID